MRKKGGNTGGTRAGDKDTHGARSCVKRTKDLNKDIYRKDCVPERREGRRCA